MTPKAQVLWKIAHFLGKEFSFWSAQQTMHAAEEEFVWDLEIEWRAACMRAELQEEEDELAVAAADPEEGADNSDEWDNTRI